MCRSIQSCIGSVPAGANCSAVEKSAPRYSCSCIAARKRGGRRTRGWTLGLLLVVSVTLLDMHRALAGTVSGKILNTSSQIVSPQMQRPQPNPNILKSPPVVANSPAFQISDFISSRAGFQPCSIPTGFLGSGQNELSDDPEYLSHVYCAKGNLTVTQTNPLANTNGKKLRLLVTFVSWGEWGPIYDFDRYELPFRNQNFVTFEVILASGINGVRGVRGTVGYGVDDRTYLDRAFQNGKPLKIQAQYEGRIYATLSCTFKSYPGVTTATIGSDHPLPDTVNCQ